MKLNTTTAIITNANRGLGRAIALAMARDDVRVSLMSRTETDLNEVRERIQQADGTCHLFPGDVSRDSDVSKMVEAALQETGRVDILVNNATVIGPVRFLEDADEEAWRQTLAVNLHDNFLEYWHSGALRNPDEVASLAVFLASSASDSITGRYGGLQDYARLGWS